MIAIAGLEVDRYFFATVVFLFTVSLPLVRVAATVFTGELAFFLPLLRETTTFFGEDLVSFLLTDSFFAISFALDALLEAFEGDFPVFAALLPL